MSEGLEGFPGFELPEAAAERYLDLELIGRGGMGEVYRAYDKELDHVVALKVLLPEQFHKESRRERFRREVFIHRQLRHKNVVRFYDYFTDETCTFFTMEFIEGESLRSYMQEGPLDPKEAVSIICQVADGLVAAHRLKILHRDIKPDNIVLNEDKVPKIMDFGLAYLTSGRDEMERLTKTGQVLGTLLFLPPEVLRSEPWDERCDVYQVGVSLYYLLTCELPFTTEALAEYATGGIQEPVQPPSYYESAVNAELDRLVMATMAPDCCQRLPSAKVLRRACQAWLDGRYKDLRLMVTEEGQSVVKTKRNAPRASKRQAIRTFLIGFTSTALLVVLIYVGTIAAHRFWPSGGETPVVSELNKKTTSPELFWAAANGDIAELKMLKTNGVPLSARDPNGWTPLHHAAASGEAKTVQFLLKEGCNGSALNNLRRTPLHLAARNGKIEILRILTNFGVPISNLDANEDTALDLAMEMKQSAAVKFLQELGG